MATSPKEIVREAMERASAITRASQAIELIGKSLSGRMRNRPLRAAFHRHTVNSVACRDPGIEPAVQGTHSFEAIIHQYPGHLGGGGLVGTGAIAEYVAVTRQVLQMLLHVDQRDADGPGDATRLELDRGWRPYINNQRRRGYRQQLMELIDGDLRHPLHGIKCLTLPLLVGDV